MDKTAGRGHKGQKSRCGAGKGQFFEGGRSTLISRLPKRGFNNVGTTYEMVNLSQLDAIEGDSFDRAGLEAAGLVRRRGSPVKLLARGSVTRAVTLHVDAASDSAIKAIEAAGGKVVAELRPAARRPSKRSLTMLRAFRDAFRIPDLQRKIVFTLLLLAVYRLGNTIPTPGVNTAAASRPPKTASSGLISMISGGNLSQFSIFALGVLPYITASIVIQLLTTTLPALEKLSKEGEEGRKKINQYTRYAAIALGAVQATVFSLFVSSNAANIAVGWTPGLFTLLVMVLTQVAGIAFTMWIGERITEVGLGNGISLIITAGIIARYPTEVAATAELFRQGNLSVLSILAFVAITILVIVAIVYVYQAERRVPVQYARARGGTPQGGSGRNYSGQATYLPIKLNQAGVIPVIFASAMLILPNLLQQATATRAPGVSAFIQQYLSAGGVWYTGLEVLLIIGFTFLYNSVQFDPKRISEQLREAGGFIPGVRPGAPTAGFLGNISTRISLWGALFLALLVVIPQLIQRWTGVTTFQFSGTGLLIIVGVALETLKQLEAQLTVRRYDGFISKGRIRGRL